MTTIKPAHPQKFAYYHPIIVRYADLDPQQHVNNAAYLTYLESARMGYYSESGLWNGQSVREIGMVVASLRIDYLKSILFGKKVRVGLMVSHIGNKSIRFQHQIEDAENGDVFARGEFVMVAYDTENERSVRVPEDWRKKIAQFEKTGDVA